MLKRDWYFTVVHRPLDLHIVRLGDKIIFKPDRPGVDEHSPLFRANLEGSEFVTRSHVAQKYEKARTRGDQIAHQVEEVIRDNKVLGKKAANDLWKAGINWDEKNSKLYRFDSVQSTTEGKGRTI